MNNSHEQIMSALFTLLQNAVKTTFTGDATKGSAVIGNASSVAALFVGLPVFGPSVPEGASVLSFDAIAKTVTLDQEIGKDTTGATFTTGFLTVGRRAALWTEVTAQPAMFLRHTFDRDEYINTVMQRTIIECEVWIYSNAGQNPNYPTDTQLNNLATAIRKALAPDVRGFPNTLGGLVQWCRVEGESAYDSGDLDNYAKALIPIRIVCP